MSITTRWRGSASALSGAACMTLLAVGCDEDYTCADLANCDPTSTAPSTTGSATQSTSSTSSTDPTDVPTATTTSATTTSTSTSGAIPSSSTAGLDSGESPTEAPGSASSAAPTSPMASSEREEAPSTSDGPEQSSLTTDVLSSGEPATATDDMAGDAEPSAGCGKANPQTGSSGAPLNVSNHQYYVKLPQGYDPNTPYPVVIMFNPTGNPISWAEGAAGFEAVAQSAIRVYPHMGNQSNGWGASDVSFFAPFYEKITGDYCMDKNRIFAGGESSGGDFVGILGCEHADKLRSVAPGATKPVGGYDLNANTRNCTGQVTAIVIHGKNDNVVGTENGPKMRDFYKALNHCEDQTTPVEGYTDTLSNCVVYQGCDEGYDTYWCNHTDPEYSGTNHGWPKFAAKMLWETWSNL